MSKHKVTSLVLAISSVLLPAVVVLNYFQGLIQVFWLMFVTTIFFVVSIFHTLKTKKETLALVSVSLVMLHACILFLLNEGHLTYFISTLLIPIGSILLLFDKQNVRIVTILMVSCYLVFVFYGFLNFGIPIMGVVLAPFIFYFVYLVKINTITSEENLIEQKRLIKKQAELLEAKNHYLEEFNYIVSHDLKAPVRGVKNYAQFLIEDHGNVIPGDGLSMLNGIVRLSDKMDSLIRDLLDFSKLEEGLTMEDYVNLNELVDNLKLEIEDYNELNINIQRNELPTVLVNELRFKEVFFNFITNASKYNVANSKKIYFEFKKDLGHLEIVDNGIGIAESDYEKVFKFFKRIHDEKEYGGGTGAGMAIVKRICDKHGVQITIDSKEGEGTKFILDLNSVITKL